MKAVIARFTELKTNVAGTAESAFDDLDYNKVDKALKSIGISVKDATGQFRNFDDIIMDLGSVWNDLDRNTQRYVATIAAGSRLQSRFISLLENYDRVVLLQEVAADSAGRADEQFAKYADTLEYKINQLKNSWEQLRTEFLNSDVFKGGVEALTGFVNKIKDLDAADIASVGIIGLTLGKSIIKSFIESIRSSTNDVRNAMDTVLQRGFSTIGKNLKLKFDIETEDLDTKIGITKGKILELAGNMEIATTSMTEDSFKIIEQYLKIGLEIDKLSAKQEKASENEKANIKEEILELQKKQAALRINFAAATGTDVSKTGELFYKLGLNKEYNLTEDTTKQKRNSAISSALSGAALTAITTALVTGIASKDVKTTLKATVTSVAISSVPSLTSAIAKAASSNPVKTAWIAGISAAVIVASAFIYKYVQAQKTEIEQLQDKIDSATDQLKDLESNEGSAKSAAKESQQQLDNIEKLKETYDELYGKTVLTTEEEEKKAELIQQIREEYPQLIKHYNSETGELQILNDLWDSIIDKQKEIAAIDLHYANIASYVKLAKEDNIESLKAQQRVAELNNASITSNILNKVQDLSNEGLSAQEIVVKLKADEDFNDEILKTVGMGGEEGLIEAILTNNKEYLENYNEVLNTEKEQQEEYIDLRKNILAQEQLLIDDLAKQTGASTNVASFAEKFMTRGIDETLAEDLNLELEKSGGLSKTAKGISDVILGINPLFTGSSIIGGALGLINDTDERFSVSQTLIDGFTDLFDIETDLASDTLDEFKDLAPELLEALRSVYGADAVEKWNDTFRYNIELLDKEAVAKAKLYNEYLNKSKEAVEKILEKGLDKNIDEFYTKLPEYSIKLIELASDDFIEAMQEGLGKNEDGDNEITNTIIENFKKQIEELKEAILKNIDFIEGIVGKGLLGDLNEADPELVQAFRTYILSLIDNGIDESTIRSFTKGFTSVFEKYGVSQDDWLPILNQLDFSSVDKSGFEAFKESGIAAIQEITGKGEEEATELFNDIAVKAKALGVLDITITTAGAAEEYVETLKEIQQNAYAERDTIISALNELAENGVLSLSTYLKLLETIANLGGNASDYLTINPNGEISLSDSAGLQALYFSKTNIQNQIATSMMDTLAKLNDLNQQLENSSLTDTEREKLEQLRDSAQLTMNVWEDAYNNAGALSAAFFNDFRTQLKQREEDTLESLEKTKEAELKAIKDLEKAREEAAKKEKAMWEAIYGSRNYKNPLDSMYNYDTNLKRATSLADDAKGTFEDLQPGNNAQEILRKYIDNVHKETVISEAEINTLEQAVANGQQTLHNSFLNKLAQLEAKYGVKFDVNVDELYDNINGRYNANLEKIDALKLPDDFKDWAANEISAWNEDLDKIDELQKKKLERLKEFNEMYKKSLLDVVNLQQEMADALKEKYQKEIDDVTEKYDAMKEADDNYLDALEKAILKERDLRDSQNKWDDLAQKEKKLSLLQRDTSGSNQLEQQKLAKEILSDRTSLLDESVDNVVDELKELYETQQEEREAELEVLNALIDEAAIMKEVVETLANINSSEELVAWFEQVSDTSAMSNEQILLLKLNWAELFQSKETYLELSKIKFDEAIETSEKEILKTVDNTSETLTTSAESTLNNVSDSVDTAIGEAKQSWLDALDDIKDKEDALELAIKNTAAAQEKHNQAVKDFNDLVKVQGLQIIKEAAEITAAAAQLAALANAQKTTTTTSTTSNSPNLNESGTSYGELNARNSSGRTNVSNSVPSVFKSEFSINNLDSDEDAAKKIREVILTSEGKGLLNKKYKSYKIDNIADAEKAVEWLVKLGIHGSLEERGGTYTVNIAAGNSDIPWSMFQLKKFASGGLVNYTGPAWVDGTPSQPEAFLSSEDTRRIGEAARILADLPLLNSKWSSDNITTTNVGDTNVEINITVEGDIKDEASVDYLVDRMKEEITKTANYVGSNVIVHR